MESVVGRRVVVVPWPMWAEFAIAQGDRAGHEGAARREGPMCGCSPRADGCRAAAASVPDDLRPRRMFTDEQIRESLTEPEGLGWRRRAR